MSSDLNERMDFDHVIEVHSDGSITDRNDLYAPECYGNEGGGIEYGGATGWTPLDGYSGQERYSGPIMHESESIGGRMERDIRQTPGIYVTVEVTDLDDQEHPYGWAVLRYDDTKD